MGSGAMPWERSPFGPSKSLFLRAALLLLLVSCGRPPDFTVHDAGVVVRSSAAFTRQPSLPSRIESTLAAALSYWGGTWNHLAGATITLEGSRYVNCHGVPNAVGCYDGDIHVSTLDSGTTLSCVEETTLVHEVGHAVIGDPGHTDPRWLDFAALARDLDGRPGYLDGGEVPCAIFVSVWRHPPNPGVASP
jgi:hypothetical protein